MQSTRLAARLAPLPKQHVCGLIVPVASGFRVRLLGLAGLDREEAGAGLLIPDCASVHTCGMRFALDLIFLDAEGRPLSCRGAVPPGRMAWERHADSVLEIPSAEGGEFAPPGT